MNTTDLLEGLAAYLAEAGVGVYRADGTAYEAGETAITLKRLPANPVTAIAVALYGLDDATELPLEGVRFQLRFRATGAHTSVDTLADSAAAALHMAHHYQLPTGIKVARTRRISIADLGVDENGRDERTDNYELIRTL